MQRTDTVAIRESIRRAYARLAHPVNRGIGVNVRAAETPAGDLSLYANLPGGKRVTLIDLKRRKGLYVRNVEHASDVRIRAALEAIEPDVRAIEAEVEHMVRGGWAILP